MCEIANGKVGETTRGERESGRNDGGETTQGERESGRKDTGANGKVSEMIRIAVESSGVNCGLV